MAQGVAVKSAQEDVRAGCFRVFQRLLWLSVQEGHGEIWRTLLW